MGTFVIKLPDVGEGIAEAEFVDLHVKPGDTVETDQNLADVMTDKATVEIPSPRKGVVEWVGPAVGDVVAVGSEILRLTVEGAGNVDGEALSSSETTSSAGPGDEPVNMAGTSEPKAQAEPKATPASSPAASIVQPTNVAEEVSPFAARAPVSGRPRSRPEGEKPLAPPAVRARARALGVDLQFVHGSGPAGRITHDDLDNYAAGTEPSAAARTLHEGVPNHSVEKVPVIGLRRKIAEKMQQAKRSIPHITYVDEIDMGALEALRRHMNESRGERPKLTLLPFLMRAIILASQKYPHINCRYDEEAGVAEHYGAAHIGIATQTDNGLMVPVVRHAEANDLWENAAEVLRLASAARNGTAKREELMGSTITITSLGAIGGLVTTPVINHPEVAIVGVNKMQTLPRYDANGQVVPVTVMNLSASFDHRIVDGWDAAQFIQTIKGYLEFPATLFAS
ncbi:MAG: dihydrolipoamide acetyltransferase family protein [Pseudomonadota bacterium]